MYLSPLPCAVPLNINKYFPVEGKVYIPELCESPVPIFSKSVSFLSQFAVISLSALLLKVVLNLQQSASVIP